MNLLQKEYAAKLEDDIKQLKLMWYGFQGITLYFEDGGCYTPMFAVKSVDGEVQFHEIRERFSIHIIENVNKASLQYPFTFILYSPTTGYNRVFNKFTKNYWSKGDAF